MNAAATTWVVLTWLEETTAARRPRALALQRNTRPKSVAIRVGSGSSPHTSSHGQARRGDIFGDTARALDCRRFPSTSSVVQVPNSTVQYSLVLYSLGPRHPSRGRAQHMTCLRSRRHKEHGPRCGLRTGWRACGDMACPRAAVFTPRPRSATLTVRDWLGNARGGLLQGSQQDRASVVLYETGLDWTGLDCSVSTLVDHAQGIV